MPKNQVLLFLFFLFSSVTLSGQLDPSYKFNHLNQRSGFPADFVYSMAQDSSGCIWLLTNEGLMRFNGHSGKRYPNNLKDVDPYLLYMAKDGKLWLTYFESGISCFDPSTESYTHYFHQKDKPESFPNAMASKFFEDSHGNFWVGTWGGGLLKFNRETKTFTALLPQENDPNSIQSTLITALTEEADGSLLVSTWEGDGYDNFIFVLDPKSNSFSRFSIAGYATENETEQLKIEAAFKIVHFIEIDAFNNLWVGTYTGLFYVDRTAKTIRRVTGLDKKLLYSKGHITFDNTTDFVYEDENTMWVSTEVGGIMVVDLNTHEVFYLTKDVDNVASLSGNIIRDMLRDSYGNIWVSTEGGGVDIFSSFYQQFRVISNERLQATRQHTAQGLYAISDFVVSHDTKQIAVAHGNGVSIYSTEFGLVQRIELQEAFLEFIERNPAYRKHNHNNANFVGTIYEITGGYYIGTHIGGIYYDSQTGSLDFTAIHDYGRYALDRYTGSEWRYKVKHDNTNPTSPDNSVSVNLYRVNTTSREKQLVVNLPLSNGTTEPYDYNTCEQLDSSTLYIYNNHNSFVLYDLKNDKLKHYSYLAPHANIPDSNHTLLHVEANGLAWIVTQNGLYTFDFKTETFSDIHQHLKLSKKDRIQSVYTDASGIVWIALRNDLIRYNPETHEIFRFGQKHGLEVGGFVRGINRHHNWDRVVFRVNYGLLVFEPAKIQFNTRTPEMMINEIILGKDTLDYHALHKFISGNPLLNWDENFIGIEFSSDLLFSPGGKTYDYRLIGLDSAWVKLGNQNKVNFTNLKPGKYTFEARCTDGFGVSSQTLMFSFEIDKPFWLKWWFIGLEIALLALFILAFVTWRERNLKRAKIKLEKTVEMRTAEVHDKMAEIETQKNIIEFKNKELTGSIQYAKRIQQTLLASSEILDTNLPEHFVFFRPKDIVSGDFYWAAKVSDSFYLAVCDSTGHGVPGAFMSLLNIRYLYEAIVEKKLAHPNRIFDYVREKLIENMSIEGGKDGMDGTLIRFDKSNNRMTYASAQNRPLLIRNHEPVILESDKMPVGGGILTDSFKEFSVDLQKGDVLYFFTDGYPDQFGGSGQHGNKPGGQKFKQKNMMNLLLQIYQLPASEQYNHLHEHLTNWKGELEQLDDILVIGIKIN